MDLLPYIGEGLAGLSFAGVLLALRLFRQHEIECRNFRERVLVELERLR